MDPRRSRQSWDRYLLRVIKPHLVTTHSIAVDVYVSQDSDHELDCKLKDVLGPCNFNKNEATVYDEFENSIQFNGDRYEVSLPWKD